MTGADVAVCVAGYLGNHFCEVIPRADPFVGVVVDAFVSVYFTVVDYVDDGVGQVLGIGGCAGLVEDNVELWACRREAEHGLDEVFAVFRVKPGRADDYVAASAFEDCLLAVQFGAAIGSGGFERLVFGTRCVAEIAAEDVVGRDVDQGDAIVGGSFCEIANRGGVDLLGDILLLFCAVYVGVGRTVDNGLEVVAAHSECHGFGVGYVEVIGIGENIFVRRVFCRFSEA